MPSICAQLLRGLPRSGPQRGPLRSRNFRLLLTCNVISMAGSAVSFLAIPFAVLALGGSASEVGYVAAAKAIPLIGVLLLGGVVADRLPRHQVILAANTLQAAAQGSTAALVLTGRAEVWQLAALAAAGGVGLGFYYPASQGLLPQTVPADQRAPANALNRTGLSVASIGGSALGGLLIAVAGPGWGLAIDAATFAVAAALRVRMRFPATPPAAAASVLQDLRDGWHEFTSRRWLWTIVLQLAVIVGVAAGMDDVLGPLVADSSLGGARSWGFIVAAYAVGAVIGGLVMIRYRPRRILLAAMLSVPALSALIFALAVPLATPLDAAAALFAGGCLQLFNVSWATTMQQEIPPAKLSRVSSYDTLGNSVLMPVGAAVAGPLAAAFGTTAVLTAGGALVVMVTAGVLLVPEVRQLCREMPAPAEPAAVPEGPAALAAAWPPPPQTQWPRQSPGPGQIRPNGPGWPAGPGGSAPVARNRPRDSCGAARRPPDCQRVALVFKYRFEIGHPQCARGRPVALARCPGEAEEVPACAYRTSRLSACRLRPAAWPASPPATQAPARTQTVPPPPARTQTPATRPDATVPPPPPWPPPVPRARRFRCRPRTRWRWRRPGSPSWPQPIWPRLRRWCRPTACGRWSGPARCTSRRGPGRYARSPGSAASRTTGRDRRVRGCAGRRASPGARPRVRWAGPGGWPPTRLLATRWPREKSLPPGPARICGWSDRLPAGQCAGADEVLLGAAAGGADLADLAGLAEEMYRRCAQPDSDGAGDGFADRWLRLDTTFRSAGLEGDLTPECTAALAAVLAALGKKAGPEDVRTQRQRDHDALAEACRRLVGSGCLPGRAGQPTQIQLHMTLDQLRGLPGAGHAEAAWAARGPAAGPGSDCDASVVPVVSGHVDPAVLDRLATAVRGRAADSAVRRALVRWPAAAGRPGAGRRGAADCAASSCC